MQFVYVTISATVLTTEWRIEQEPQALPIGSRVLGAILICGRVSRSGGDAERHLGFDVDISQWGAVNHQTVRVLCYYPFSLPRLGKTPIPNIGRHVVVEGVLHDIEDERCIIYVNDIAFNSPNEQPIAEAPSSKLTHFDWYGKGKGKRARYDEKDESATAPSTSGAK